MFDKVYIVVSLTNNGYLVESAWTTKELAESAIEYYKLEYSGERFEVLTRTLNRVKEHARP